LVESVVFPGRPDDAVFEQKPKCLVCEWRVATEKLPPVVQAAPEVLLEADDVDILEILTGDSGQLLLKSLALLLANLHCVDDRIDWAALRDGGDVARLRPIESVEFCFKALAPCVKRIL